MGAVKIEGFFKDMTYKQWLVGQILPSVIKDYSKISSKAFRDHSFAISAAIQIADDTIEALQKQNDHERDMVRD